MDNNDTEPGQPTLRMEVTTRPDAEEIAADIALDASHRPRNEWQFEEDPPSITIYRITWQQPPIAELNFYGFRLTEDGSAQYIERLKQFGMCYNEPIVEKFDVTVSAHGILEMLTDLFGSEPGEDSAILEILTDLFGSEPDEDGAGVDRPG